MSQRMFNVSCIVCNKEYVRMALEQPENETCAACINAEKFKDMTGKEVHATVGYVRNPASGRNTRV